MLPYYKTPPCNNDSLKEKRFSVVIWPHTAPLLCESPHSGSGGLDPGRYADPPGVRRAGPTVRPQCRPGPAVQALYPARIRQAGPRHCPAGLRPATSNRTETAGECDVAYTGGPGFHNPAAVDSYSILYESHHHRHNQAQIPRIFGGQEDAAVELVHPLKPDCRTFHD